MGFEEFVLAETAAAVAFADDAEASFALGVAGFEVAYVDNYYSFDGHP